MLSHGVCAVIDTLSIDKTQSGAKLCAVLAARSVTAKDSGGTSDVYCQVYLDKEKILKTEVLKKTVDPVFEHEKGKLLCVPTATSLHV